MRSRASFTPKKLTATTVMEVGTSRLTRRTNGTCGLLHHPHCWSRNKHLAQGQRLLMWTFGRTSKSSVSGKRSTEKATVQGELSGRTYRGLVLDDPVRSAAKTEPKCTVTIPETTSSGPTSSRTSSLLGTFNFSRRTSLFCVIAATVGFISVMTVYFGSSYWTTASRKTRRLSRFVNTIRSSAERSARNG